MRTCWALKREASHSLHARNELDHDLMWEDNMRCLVSAVVLVSLGALIGPATADDVASSIAGLWNITSFTRNEVGTGKATNFYGEHPRGYFVYTRGGPGIS